MREEKNIEIRERIIGFVKRYTKENNIAPNYEEIANELGFVAKSNVYRYVKQLEADGLITLKGHRGISLTQKVRVPIVGSIACGLPSYAEQDIEDFVEILKDELGSGEHFVLRAKGESMINAGIHDGDLVIIRRQNTANEGQIVVALLEDEATLKRLKIDKKNKKFILHPENPKFDDMIYDRVVIQGVAVRVLNNLE